MIRVVVADDEGLVRGGLQLILDAQPDIEVVGLAENGARAVELVRQTAPDVVLMDVQMPVLDGLEATRQVLAELPCTKVVMITTFDVDDHVHRSVAAGASGFLLKDTRAEVLADAVRTVVGGEALLSPTILRRLVEHHSRPARASSASALVDRLTERELDVFRLVGRGLSNQEIGRELWISESTVKTHVTRLFTKLGLRDRAQAVVLAYESGLLTAGESMD